MPRTPCAPLNASTFARSFSAEDLLQQAIASLLSKIPAVTGVQILQGTMEFGKDIVFYSPGGFGERIFSACVVKNTKITGSAALSEGARAIYHQAQQALDTPHINEHGQEVRVDRVYVVTPFSLSPATIQSIMGRLKLSSSAIRFIHGPALFDLFKQYWPEFLATEFSALEDYLQQAAADLSPDRALSEAAFMYGIGAIEPDVKRVYVHPLFERTVFLHSLRSSVTADFLATANDRLNLARKQDKRATLPDFRTEYREWSHLRDGGQVMQNWRFCNDRHLLTLSKRWKSITTTSERARRRLEVLEGEVALKKRHPDDLLRYKSEAAANLIPKVDKFTSAKAELLAELGSTLTNASQDLPTPGSAPAEVLASLAFRDASVLTDLSTAESSAPVQRENSVSFGFPAKILDEWGPSIFIVGAAGHGKTSFCYWHALNDTENFSTGQSDVLPAYVALHHYSTGRIGSFKQTFLKHLGKSALIASTGTGKARAQGKIRLYMDGLDEIPAARRRRQIVEMTRKEVQRRSDLQVVITARDYVNDQSLCWLPKLYISPFNDQQIRELVNKWLDSDRDQDVFYDQLDKSPALGPLLRVPLLATLTILVFRQTNKLPENVIRLYDVFVDLLCGGWDLAKRVQRGSTIHSSAKVMILKRLAYRAHLQARRRFDDRLVSDVVTTTIVSGKKDYWRIVKGELLQDGLLTAIGSSLEFSHLSFQEFLAAKNMVGEPQGHRLRYVLGEFLKGDDWWKEVLLFFIGLCGNPAEMVDTLRVARVSQQNDRVVFLREAVEKSYPRFPLPAR